MTIPGPLEALKSSLATINARLVIGALGDPRPMARTAETVERRFGEGRPPDHDVVVRTLRAFLENGALTGYRDIRNACYGLLTPLHGRRCIADNLKSTQALLNVVGRYEREPKKLKRCFQALLAAYFELDGCEAKAVVHAQWQELRARLAAWLPALASVTPRPDWLDAAFEHRNLLTAEPTKRYGVAILRGDTREFDSACARLSIGPLSWVRRRAVMSAVEAATSERDTAFLGHLATLIALVRSNTGVSSEGTAKLINRYVAQSAPTEHMGLRSLAIDTFGNPLVTANKQRWFEVSPEGREMISNWLKTFIIERFFELLSHDGRSDKRRPKFWIEYRGSIENMWFVLGSAAQDNRNDDFKKLRATMGNNCLLLEGTTSGNNAFIMKLGNVLVVEFGEKGNAAFVFDAISPPVDLARTRQIHISKLRSKSHVERLLHMDGRETWEQKFSTALAGYGIYPDDAHRRRGTTSRTTMSEGNSDVRLLVKQFCNQRGLRYDDRAASGRLVVYADSSNPVICGTLGQWGFVYQYEHRRWVRSP